MGLMVPTFDRHIQATVQHLVIEKNLPVLMEVCIPGIANVWDTSDIISIIEPNNLFISATENDKFCSNAKELYDLSKDKFKSGNLNLGYTL